MGTQKTCSGSATEDFEETGVGEGEGCREGERVGAGSAEEEAEEKADVSGDSSGSKTSSKTSDGEAEGDDEEAASREQPDKSSRRNATRTAKYFFIDIVLSENEIGDSLLFY